MTAPKQYKGEVKLEAGRTFKLQGTPQDSTTGMGVNPSTIIKGDVKPKQNSTRGMI